MVKKSKKTKTPKTQNPMWHSDFLPRFTYQMLLNEKQREQLKRLYMNNRISSTGI